MMLPKISIFSTPLVSTWIFDDTHRILFDAGDGVSAMLEGNIHRAKWVAITHTHRDHCAGLMQLMNLRCTEGPFTAIYPDASGSAKTLSEFLSRFDTRSTSRATWRPMRPGETEPVEPARHFLRAFPTQHYPGDPTVGRSLGYQLCRHIDRLRPECQGLSQAELDALRIAGGKQAITQTEEDVLLSVSGDTLTLDPEVYRGSMVLLHECTFLDRDEAKEMASHGHAHSYLDGVLDLAKEAGVGHLGLYHISRRYETDRLFNRVRSQAAAIRLNCPVSIATPGRYHDDLLSKTAWKGMEAEEARGKTAELANSDSNSGGE